MTTKIVKQIAYFLNNRPLCFLSTVFGLRDILVGLALAIPSHDYSQTVLYANLNTLGGVRVYGVLLTLISLIVVVTAVADRGRLTQWGLKAMSWFWLFAAISYALTDHWLFAISNFLVCAVPAGYISFYYKWAVIWDYPKRKWRAKYGAI